MEEYKSISLLDFIKYVGGNKIVSGINEDQVWIMNEINKTVGICHMSNAVPKDWSLQSLIKSENNIEYHVYVNGIDGKNWIYPIKIGTILKR